MNQRVPEVIGDLATAGPPALTGVVLELRALDLVAHWKRCGITADWLAGFFAYDFEPEARAAAASVRSTAINELIENAAKFCDDKLAPVAIAVRHHGDFVRLETRNRCDGARAGRLRDALAALGGDLDALFAARIERQEETGASGLGLLILKRDYGARVGARLTPGAGDTFEVELQVTLDAEQIGGST